MKNTRIYTQIKTVAVPLEVDNSIYLKDSSTAIFLDPSNNLMFRDRVTNTNISLTSLSVGYVPYVDASLGQRDVSINLLNTSKASVAYVDGSLARRDASIAVRPTFSYVDSSLLIRDASITSLHFKNDQVMVYGGNGVLKGCTISINPSDNTRFDVSSGVYVVMDASVYDHPTYTRVTYPGTTGVLISNFTANATYIALDASGNVTQKSSPYTPGERRTRAILGVAVHSNHININVTNNTPDVAKYTHSQLMDFFDVFGIINKSGNKISYNGANLSINKSPGTIFKRGVGFTGGGDSNEIYLDSLIAPATIRYRRADGTEYADRSTIDLSYQSGPTTITAIPSNRYSIQRVVLFPSNLIRIQYGPEIYSTLELAAAAISSEAFTLESNMAENGIVRCFLIVRGTMTDLSNTADAKFVEADKFGQNAAGSASGGSSTLQQAYNNSSVPQIITDATRQALQIKIGTTSSSDYALQVLDTSSNITTSFSGNGFITANNLSLSRLNTRGIQIDGSFGWRTQLVQIIPKSGGPNDPTFAAFRGGNVSAYTFSASDAVDCIVFRIPNDYLIGSDVHVNVNWSHNGTAISGSLVNTWYVTYAKGHQQAIFPAELTITQTISTPDISTYAQWQHNTSSFQISNAGGDSTHIDRALLEPGGLIVAKLSVTTIPTITGGSPNEPFFFTVSMSYQSTMLGTRNRTPNFYS
jgi:hypothetical protein